MIGTLDIMLDQTHAFHIPVMGIGHSIDTPIRVAPLGISSVLSLVDDLLLEKLRKHYAQTNDLPYVEIPRNEHDGRARRITAYLDIAQAIVSRKFEAIRKQPLFESNEKQFYFELLPDESPLKSEFQEIRTMTEGLQRDTAAKRLESKMRPGSIDVNIMVKLDRTTYDRHGRSLGEEFTDAKSALRGYANSALRSSVVFSAGMNPKLFAYLSRFRDFYRDACGEIKKKIILKVSDFRSALVQSKFLAKRGLEVSEYRIESALNCGGHAFPSRGQLLPFIFKEFKEKWHELTDHLRPWIREYYRKMGWPDPNLQENPRITVQGGIGTSGEARRLKERFGANGTGWGSPFLLVPEATNVDDATRDLLCGAKEKDLYLSTTSPLGIPFNTVRGTRSELVTHRRVENGVPGSPCPNGFAVTNTEFTDRPICLASRQYQKKKLEQIDQMALAETEKESLRNSVVEKTCICDHLGHGVQIKLGLADEAKSAQAICPGPNIAWFDRTYTLKEMVDHIYGRRPSLVPRERPHMFAKEIEMNVDYLETLIVRSELGRPAYDDLLEYKSNLEKGMDLCEETLDDAPYQDENLLSIESTIKRQRQRLATIWHKFLTKSGCIIQADVAARS